MKSWIRIRGALHEKLDPAPRIHSCVQFFVIFSFVSVGFFYSCEVFLIKNS